MSRNDRKKSGCRWFGFGHRWGVCFAALAPWDDYTCVYEHSMISLGCSKKSFSKCWTRFCLTLSRHNEAYIECAKYCSLSTPRITYTYHSHLAKLIFDTTICHNSLKWITGFAVRGISSFHWFSGSKFKVCILGGYPMYRRRCSISDLRVKTINPVDFNKRWWVRLCGVLVVNMWDCREGECKCWLVE